ncbi:extensin family protein [Qipengyuania seohaensis]|uniref:extensin family protein n=1 Tax=Qipengyuania seohaensis TaxID=266951 RepID=UPI000C22CB22|nr:extensin family protein [Qipengyuania seohaensis]
MRIAALSASLAALALAACGAVPERGGAAPSRPTSSAQTLPQPTGEALQCLAELGSTRAQFSPLPDKLQAGSCSTENTVRLSALHGDTGRFDVTNLTTVACPVAKDFAAWARFGVDRAARQILGSGLERIETMGSYSCRNVAGTNRLSAHSRAQAVDVSAFVLNDGRRITVQSGWNASPAERQFLRTIHSSACKRFGTVLGPDYNAAHRDHLHLEFGRGSFCR